MLVEEVDAKQHDALTPLGHDACAGPHIFSLLITQNRLVDLTVERDQRYGFPDGSTGNRR